MKQDKNVIVYLLTSAAKFFKYNRIYILYTLIIGALVYMNVFGSKGFIQKWKLGNEKTALEKELKVEEHKGDSLKKEVEEIKTSDRKLEQIAREKYGMTKEGEKIYRVLIDTTK